ncbi:hypothetical protein ANO11243_065970 [Dothideomycetidae sp. 11243]|nr:hypothetical protein ANO11243_065970 [fungal sp. No.11243]
MISDGNLYNLAVFLGSTAVLLIVLYHFLEVNALDTPTSNILDNHGPPSAANQKAAAAPVVGVR